LQHIQRGNPENIQLVIQNNGSATSASGSVTVTIYDADDTTNTVLSSGSATYDSTYTTYSYPIEGDLVQYDRNLKALWSYSLSSGSYTQQTFAEVATPYATVSEIIDFYNFGTKPQDINYKSEQQIIQAERIAKSIINNYTSLTFGQRTGYQEIFGIGSDAIELTERMISISKIYENDVLVVDNTSSASYNSFGYTVVLTPTGKAARIYNPGWDTRYDSNIDVNVREWGKFRNGTRYAFTGTIGYEYVPQEIKICSILLIGDLLSQDSAWRNKYLSDVKVGELQFKLAGGAFNGTGNVIVDGILDQYRNVGIVVI
jgi:hypothetical protein